MDSELFSPYIDIVVLPLTLAYGRKQGISLL